MQSNQTPQLPMAFFAQLVARLKVESPRFYVIIQQASVGLAVLGSVLGIIIFVLLPQANIAVPSWLNSSQALIGAIVGLLAGVGLGGAGVASTTIQTPSTPPLASAEPKVTLEQQVQQMMSQLAEQNATIEQLKAQQQSGDAAKTP